MRASFVGIAVVTLALAAWAIPWIPIGMDVEDYDVATVTTFVLAGIASLAVQGFIYVWAPQFQGEPLPEFLRVLMGAHRLIRGPRQFYSRLAAECRQCRADRRNAVSLVIVEMSGVSEAPAAKPELMEQREALGPLLVRGSVRAQDVVAVSWPREVWVLAVATGRNARVGIMRRLARAIAVSELPADVREACRIGGSTFALDGEEPDALFSVARERLSPLSELIDVAPAA